MPTLADLSRLDLTEIKRRALTLHSSGASAAMWERRLRPSSPRMPPIAARCAQRSWKACERI
jgi:hypothetical protein